MDDVADITVQILRDIRDEIALLRRDTNARFEQVDRRFEQMDRRFEQMDKRFERMDRRFERIETDIKSVATHFDRDYLTLANRMGELEGRLDSHIARHHTSSATTP